MRENITAHLEKITYLTMNHKAVQNEGGSAHQLNSLSVIAE